MERRWKILILASLAANLFLIGAFAAVLAVGMRFLDDRRDFRRDGGPGLRTAYQSLPEERRQALRRMMREQAQAAGPDLREAREARREAARLIAQPVYDAAAVTAALQRARDAQTRASAKIDSALAARLAQLSPEERAAFAEVMVRGRRGDGFRGGRDGRGPRRDPERPPSPLNPSRPAGEGGAGAP